MIRLRLYSTGISPGNRFKRRTSLSSASYQKIVQEALQETSGATVNESKQQPNQLVQKLILYFKRYQARRRAWNEHQQLLSQMSSNYRETGSIHIAKMRKEIRDELVSRQLPFYMTLSLFLSGATLGILLVEVFWIRRDVPESKKKLESTFVATSDERNR